MRSGGMVAAGAEAVRRRGAVGHPGHGLNRALQADGQDFDAASTVSKAGEAMTQRFLQWAWTVSGAPLSFSFLAVYLAGRYGQDG